jgi:hypothetical protein
MRAAFAALILATTPALADLRLEPGTCPTDDGCLATVTLRNLSASPARSLVIGDALVLVGIGPGPSGLTDSLMVVDIDLSGAPNITGVTELDATFTERIGTVEVAPDGTAYALFTHDERDHLNRNRRVGAIQFFDELGQRQGRVTSPYSPDWPETVEWTPVDLLESHAGTNALRFADGKMSLRFGRFVLFVGISDGRMTLTETAPAVQNDPLPDLLDRLFDPVGGERIWVANGLTGYYNYPADGSPSALHLATPPITVPLDVLGHADMIPAELEPNPDDYSRDYAAITISPDTSLLAVIRLTDTSCDPDPVPYDLVVYDTGTGKEVWSAPGTRPGIVQQGLAFTRDNRLILTEARGAVDPPCGPSDDPPAIAVTIYDPRPAP